MAQIGDIFMLPLGDGRSAIGQVIEKRETASLAMIAVFPTLLNDDQNVTQKELEAWISSVPAFFASSFDNAIDLGNWKKIANIAPALGSQNSPAFRVAGLPFGLILESYDGKQRRWARLREINAAPNPYSVSAKWLENAVKAYFKLSGTQWDSKFEKLLFKNVIPFKPQSGAKS